ncbi:MAG: hypothetical protein WKF86_04075 [Acidimicrobiales bacterium]
MGAILTLSEQAVTALPGGTARVTASVINTGSAVDELSVTVEGEAAGWAVVDPPGVVLFPGAEGHVNITFQVPEGARARPGPTPFAVRAAGSSDTTASRVDGVVDVAPHADATLSLRPEVLQGSKRARGSLIVENRGNARAELHLSASGEQMSVSVEPSLLLVGPGEVVSAIVTASPDRSFLRGPGQRLPFIVTAEGADHPQISVHGTMAQRA